MKIEEIGHGMTQISEVLVNTSGKLNQVADLNLLVGRKLDKNTENAQTN